MGGRALALQIGISNRTFAVTINERGNLMQPKINDQIWTFHMMLLS